MFFIAEPLVAGRDHQSRHPDRVRRCELPAVDVPPALRDALIALHRCQFAAIGAGTRCDKSTAVDIAGALRDSCGASPTPARIEQGPQRQALNAAS
jgi:hypothetical protein